VQATTSGPGGWEERPWANDLALDGSGNIYTTGLFRRTVDFDPGAGTYSLTSTLDSSGNPTLDVFVSKLVPSGGPLAATGSGSATSTAAVTDAGLMLMLADDPLSTTKRK
jgi:hypothetical protein